MGQQVEMHLCVGPLAPWKTCEEAVAAALGLFSESHSPCDHVLPLTCIRRVWLEFQTRSQTEIGTLPLNPIITGSSTFFAAAGGSCILNLDGENFQEELC